MAHIQPTVSGFKNRKSFFFFFWHNFGLLVFEPLAVFCPQKNNAESTVSPSEIGRASCRERV